MSSRFINPRIPESEFKSEWRKNFELRSAQEAAQPSFCMFAGCQQRISPLNETGLCGWHDPATAGEEPYATTKPRMRRSRTLISPRKRFRQADIDAAALLDEDDEVAL